MSREFEEEDYLRELLQKFESVLKDSDSYVFFDTAELEDIIFHYFNEADFLKARKAIDYALKRFPTDITFEVFRAQYLLNTGQSEKALILIDLLRVRDPDNPDISLTRGSILSTLGKHDEAIADFLKALPRVDTDTNEVYQSIAFEYEAVGEYSKAIDYLVKALLIDNENESLLYEIGYCYDLAGDGDGAIRFFKNYTDKFPYSYVAWYNLGLAYSIMELYEKAIDALDFSIAIEPHFIPAHFSKAQSYEQMEMYTQAIHVYKQTMEFETPDAMLYYYIGDCYENLNNFSLALEYYRKSVGIERQFADAWMGIGICLNELGQHSEAVSNMKQAVKLEPENPEFWYIYADALLDDGQPDEAEIAFEEVIKLDPEHPEIWLDFSDFYAHNRNNIERAIELIEEGAYHQPDNSVISYRIVAYLLEAGREKEAIRELYIALSQSYENHVYLLEYSEKARITQAVTDAISSFSRYTE